MLFKNLIKIPGKNFGNLTKSEAADMIDAYLSNGSQDYDASALPEFMLVPNKVDWLESLRIDLTMIDESRRSPDSLDGLDSAEGKADLQRLSQNLRTSS